MDSQNLLIVPQPKHESRFSRFHRRKHSETIKIVGGYKIGGKLGEGSNGYVYSAYRLDTEKKVAVKIIPKTQETAEKLKNQIDIISSISHPNVVRVYEIIQQQNKVFIFIELCSKGDLFYYINNKSKLDQKESALIFIKILEVLIYLHDRGIAHRDIKAENILLDELMQPKLSDFGLAKMYNSKEKTLLQTWCGSFNYVAPQIIKKRKYKPQLVDLWSLCVTLYIMLLGREPFNRTDDRNVTKQCIISFDWEKDSGLSQQARELFDLVFVPAQHRISLQQVQSTRFYRKYSNYEQNNQNLSQSHHPAVHSHRTHKIQKQSLNRIAINPPSPGLKPQKKRSSSRAHDLQIPKASQNLNQFLSQPIETEYGHVSQLLGINAHNKVELIKILRQQRENKNYSHDYKFRVRRSLPKKIQYFYEL